MVSPDGTAGNQISTEIYALHIANNGNVGIGTTDPVRNLEVVSDNSSIQLRLSRTGNAQGITDLGSDNNGFYIYPGGYSANKPVVIKMNGNVGIGTTDPQNYKLAVNGAIIAEDITVQLHDDWVNYPDFVFSNKYKMMDLPRLERFIKQKNHLPGIPTAKEVSESGLKLGEMNQKLLQKIEELTLYIIEQDKKLNQCLSQTRKIFTYEKNTFRE